MYMTCKHHRTGTHTANPTAPLFLLLTVVVIQQCTVIVSAKTVRELEFTSHAKQDHHAAGHVDVLPVPSNHTFKCVCSGRLVQMLSGKKVDATGKNRNAYSELLITSASFKGLVRIQNARTKQYICFNGRGKLKVKHSSDAKCIFEELHNSDPLENTYMYRSYKYKYKNYYLGFNKHGKKLKGTLPDQKRKQKCYKFLKSGSDRSFDKNEWSAQKGPRYGVEGDFTHLAITPRRRHLRHKARERRRQKADIT